MSNLSISLRDSPLRGQSLRIESINLDQELQEIEKLIGAGITPSAERIKEYVQISCLKGQEQGDSHKERDSHLSADMQKVVSCIADILRMEEENCCQTDAALKDILVVLESTSNLQELRRVFLGESRRL